MRPIHKQLSKSDLNITQMVFDATGLYHSAMWDNDSVYPEKESGYTFKPHMNNAFVNDFNTQTFSRDGND